MLGWTNNGLILYKMVSNKSIYMQDAAQECVCHIKCIRCEMHWFTLRCMSWHLHTWMLLLPVVELLWSSPGTHFSVTFLPLWSDSTKFSGASGTSENHRNGTAFRKRKQKSQGHKISAARKRPGEQTFDRSRESEDVERAASLCCLSLFSLDFNMSTTSSKKLC